MGRRKEKPGKRKGKDRAWQGQVKREKKEAKRRVRGREELREGKNYGKGRGKREKEKGRGQGKRDKPHSPNDLVGKKFLPDYVGVTVSMQRSEKIFRLKMHVYRIGTYHIGKQVPVPVPDH
jgi:hypothetical protein